MEEIWKDIPNYEGHYMVSNFGRVKSMNYKKQKGVEGIMKLKFRGQYLSVMFADRKCVSIHRLVALAFIGKLTNLVVNHKDFNKINNHLSNLEIITFAENHSHSLNDRKIRGVYSSKLKGVSYFKNTGKWRAQKWSLGKKKHIGYFNTEIEAFNALQ
jgi:hypothetical protein